MVSLITQRWKATATKDHGDNGCSSSSVVTTVTTSSLSSNTSLEISFPDESWSSVESDSTRLSMRDSSHAKTSNNSPNNNNKPSPLQHGATCTIHDPKTLSCRRQRQRRHREGSQPRLDQDDHDHALDQSHLSTSKNNIHCSCSFRPANSLGRAEVADLDLLDLSLHDAPSSPRQQRRQESRSVSGIQQDPANHRDNVGSRNTQQVTTTTAAMSRNNKSPTRMSQGEPAKKSPRKERNGSLAAFMMRRVETFATNVETIGLLLVGQRELDL